MGNKHTLRMLMCCSHYRRVRSRSAHGQGRYLPVFKCICSYQRSWPAHCPVTVREDICLY